MTGDTGVGSVAMGIAVIGENVDGAMGVVDIGNPHVVVSDDLGLSQIDREHWAQELSRKVNGANVEFIRIDSPRQVSMKVYERGVGWTQACGTGSCAVAALTNQLGLTGTKVDVVNPGGVLTVVLDRTEVTLTGPVQFVAHVE
jgi:diaminopimelate epimerase